MINWLIDTLIDLAIFGVMGYAVFKLAMSVPMINKVVTEIWTRRREIIQKLKEIVLRLRNSQR